MAKKRNPQDSTLRNVRAAKAHKAALDRRVTALEQKVRAILRAIRTLSVER